MAAIKGIEGMDGKEFAYELQRGGICCLPVLHCL